MAIAPKSSGTSARVSSNERRGGCYGRLAVSKASFGGMCDGKGHLMGAVLLLFFLCGL